MAEPGKLKIVPNETVERIVLEHLRRLAQTRGRLAILEAGCGRRWPYRLDEASYVLTGVDVSADALRIRQQEKGDLHHALVGDLRTIGFAPRSFDVIYSSFVLEHVVGAARVLDNFARWLKPGGLMVVKVPDRDSVYGLVTRLTPFWVHVLYKRHLCGRPNAGNPGFGPFPTVHERIIARGAFRDFARRHDLRLLEEYGFGTLPGVQQIFTQTCAALSLGRFAGDHYNLCYIVQAPEAAPQPVSIEQPQAEVALAAAHR
jgi:SAM-dependent methyltransferase